jgi:hypothetical protein
VRQADLCKSEQQIELLSQPAAAICARVDLPQMVLATHYAAVIEFRVLIIAASAQLYSCRSYLEFVVDIPADSSASRFGWRFKGDRLPRRCPDISVLSR